jgi:hypothetical protein
VQGVSQTEQRISVAAILRKGLPKRVHGLVVSAQRYNS